MISSDWNHRLRLRHCLRHHHRNQQLFFQQLFFRKKIQKRVQKVCSLSSTSSGTKRTQRMNMDEYWTLKKWDKVNNSILM